MKAKGWTRLFTTLTVLLCLGCGAAIIFYNLLDSLVRLDGTVITVCFFGCCALFLLSVSSLTLVTYAEEHGVNKSYRIALAAAAVCGLGCSFYFGIVFFGLAALYGRAEMDTAMILPGLAVCR